MKEKIITPIMFKEQGIELTDKQIKDFNKHYDKLLKKREKQSQTFIKDGIE